MTSTHRPDLIPLSPPVPTGTIWSIGHSNLPWDAFEALLRAHGIRALADVRSFPSSRRWPQFDRETMAQQLLAAGITYRWLPGLGGRRQGIRTDSPHRGWTVPAFRHYADHMESLEFAGAAVELTAVAKERPTAFMCAEARHWQCHRRLLADRLTSAGWRVLHIASATRAEPHRYPPFLRIVDGRLLYDGDPAVDPDDPQGTLPIH